MVVQAVPRAAVSRDTDIRYERCQRHANGKFRTADRSNSKITNTLTKLENSEIKI